ncbi:Uncharacterised protein [Klebsiella pneumoniae]|nr:Uncharacterised protein [Klebsiella pneumoniae]
MLGGEGGWLSAPARTESAECTGSKYPRSWRWREFAGWSGGASAGRYRLPGSARRIRRQGSWPSAASGTSAGTTSRPSVGSACQRDGQRRCRECRYEISSTIAPSRAYPASGWMRRARYTARNRSAASCPPERRCRTGKGRYRKRRRSDTGSFRASGADVNVLRRHILTKASLISLHRRAIASGRIIFDKLHLLFFPHGVQRLTGIVALFSRHLFCDTVTGERAFSQRQQGVKQLVVRAGSLLKTAADQRQNRRDILQPSRASAGGRILRYSRYSGRWSGSSRQSICRPAC